MLGNDFGTFLTISIPDKTLQALCLYISTLGYLEDGALYFKDVTDTDNLILSLSAKLDYKQEQERKRKEEEDNGCLKVIDSKDKMIKKKNKRVGKRKTRLASFHAEA